MAPVMIGASLNQYRITASIGAGGMGEVFRARDTRLNRDVAVKVLPKDFVADADRHRRFEQELRFSASRAGEPWFIQAITLDGRQRQLTSDISGLLLQDISADGRMLVTRTFDF